MSIKLGSKGGEVKEIVRRVSGTILANGKQGWRSGESTRLPPMWPRFNSRTRRHKWVGLAC